MYDRTNALVLRSVDYRDFDKILTLLTSEHGKMTVTARNSRKRNNPLAAASQILIYSDMQLSEYQGRWSLKEAELIRQFRNVQWNVERFSLGCYFAEAAEALALEELPSQPLLSLILNGLHVLDRAPDRPLKLVKATFELRAACVAGYEPALQGCAKCGQQEPKMAWFLPADGVFYCNDCMKKTGIPLPPPVLAAARHVVYGKPERLFSFRLEEPSLTQFAELCEQYLITQLDCRFATLEFFKELQQPPDT